MFSKAAIIALIPALAAAQTCTDDAAFTFVLDNEKPGDCDWLTKNNSEDRIPKYCEYGSVKWACQATCESCAETCADSSTFEFTLDSDATGKDCDWLTKNEENAEKRKEAYCDRDDDEPAFEVGAACPESCGFC